MTANQATAGSALTRRTFRHREEQSDEAISTSATSPKAEIQADNAQKKMDPRLRGNDNMPLPKEQSAYKHDMHPPNQVILNGIIFGASWYNVIIN